MMWELECQGNVTTGQVAKITATINNNHMTQTCIMGVHKVALGQRQLITVQSDDTVSIQR